MTRLNLVLLLALLASALYLVHMRYESRRLFSEIDRAQGEARKLDLEHDRLQAERRAQATPLRVEKLAKEQLQMRSASPAITQYVPAPQNAPAPQTSGTGATPPSAGQVSAATAAASGGARP